MSNSITLGSPGMFEQPLSYGYSPSGGPYTVRTWKGGAQYVPSLTAQLRAARLEYEVQEGPGNAIVRCRIARDNDGSQEQPTNVWERAVNRHEKSIYEHSKFAGLSLTQKLLIKKAVRDFGEAEDGAKAAAAGASLTGVSAEIYDVATKGVESFIVEQPVVRLTETVSADFALSVSKANIGKVLTAAQMSSLEGAPSAVLDNKTPPVGLEYTRYGYRKGDPTISQAAGGKWQVMTEWEAGFWSTLLYCFVP